MGAHRVSLLSVQVTGLMDYRGKRGDRAADSITSEIAQILDIRDYKAATHLVLATRDGKVKKTFLSEYDTNRQGGIIAIRLRGQDD